MSLVKAAQHIAQRGRYGDDSILHVSHKEIQFLEGLAGAELPRNPDTGAKEAFFFLPFLAPLAGAVAPAAAAGAGAMAAGLQAGLAAAGTAAAGTAASVLPGIGAAAGGLGSAAATAAPAALSGVGSALGSVAPAATTGLTAAGNAGAAASGLGAMGSSVLPAAVDPVVTGAIGGAGAATPAATAATSGLTLPATTTAIPTASPGLASTSVGGAAPQVLSGVGSPGTLPAGGPWGAGPAPIASSAGPGSFPTAPPSAMTTAGGPWGAGEAPNAGQIGAGAFPEATKTGGLGGLFGNMDTTSMMQGLGLLSMMRGSGGGGGDDDEDEEKDISKETYKGGKPVFPDKDYKGGIDDEWDYFRGYAKGGKVKKGKGGSSDEAIVEGAVAALQGQSPNPQKAIELFVQTFGQQALQDLMSRMGMGGGLGAAQSHGQSDSIPAMIDGQQPAALSEGEWVVPSDVVSGLGNGSTEAGARQLQAMQDKVRSARGQPKQPPAINPQEVMPA